MPGMVKTDRGQGRRYGRGRPAARHHRGDENGERARAERKATVKLIPVKEGESLGRRRCHHGIRVRAAHVRRIGRRRLRRGVNGRFASKEGKGARPDDLMWQTPEGIAVKPLYTSTIWIASTISITCRVKRLTFAVRRRRCMPGAPGPSANMPAFRPPKTATRSTAEGAGRRSKGLVRRVRSRHPSRL